MEDELSKLKTKFEALCLLSKTVENESQRTDGKGAHIPRVQQNEDQDPDVKSFSQGGETIQNKAATTLAPVSTLKNETACLKKTHCNRITASENGFATKRHRCESTAGKITSNSTQFSYISLSCQNSSEEPFKISIGSETLASKSESVSSKDALDTDELGNICCKEKSRGKCVCFCVSAINRRDEHGLTPLHHAVMQQQGWELVQVVSSLVNMGADINICDEREHATALIRLLWKFCWRRELDRSCLLPLVHLLTSKRNVSAQNKYGYTALHYAVTLKHWDVVYFLTQLGADLDCVNRDEQTPLLLAAARVEEMDDNNAIMALITKANVNTQDTEGNTALHYVAPTTKCKVLQRLIHFGADVNLVNKRNQTPLHWAVLQNKNSELCLIKSSIQFYCFYDIDSLLNDYTALQALLMNTRNIIIQTLVSSNADVCIQDHAERTVLHYGIALDVTTFGLLVHKNNIDLQDAYGDTALHLAFNSHSVDIAHYLLLRKADVNIQNNEGQSALHSAIFMGALGDAKALWHVISVKNIDMRDIHGCSALQYAVNKGLWLHVAYLIQYGADFSSFLGSSFSKRPQSLLHISALAANRLIGEKTDKMINQLDIPRDLLPFLKLRHVALDVIKNSQVQR